jgi:hypothetical protein
LYEENCPLVGLNGAAAAEMEELDWVRAAGVKDLAYTSFEGFELLILPIFMMKGDALDENPPEADAERVGAVRLDPESDMEGVKDAEDAFNPDFVLEGGPIPDDEEKGPGRDTPGA